MNFRNLVLLMAVAGCTSTRPAPDRPRTDPGFPGHGAAEILRRLPTPDSLWHQLTAEAAISYRIGSERGSVTAQIAYRQRDSLFVRFRGPAGIEAMRALYTADSVLVYDRLRKTLYAGAADVDTPMLPAFFQSLDLVVSLLGFIAPSTDVDWRVTHDSLRYRLRSPDGRDEYVVDPAWWRVLSHDVRDARGTVLETRKFTDFERLDGLLLPRRIVVTQPAEGARASLYVRRLAPSPTSPSFDLDLKPDVRRVPLH